MKVLLLKDVYKLGRAGEVKKVAGGYGRNYLITQGMAVLATPGALKQAERISAEATIQRDNLNAELSTVADQIRNTVLVFSANAGETGKLYGSITTQMIVDELSKKIHFEVNRRQIDSQPLRILGTHRVPVRLTMDLNPEISVIIHREGEAYIAPKPAEVVAQIQPDITMDEETIELDIPEPVDELDDIPEVS